MILHSLYWGELILKKDPARSEATLLRYNERLTSAWSIVRENEPEPIQVAEPTAQEQKDLLELRSREEARIRAESAEHERVAAEKMAVQKRKDSEKPAASILASGKRLADNGNVEGARRFYQKVIDSYPGTEAAKEAQALLDGSGR